MKYPFLFMSPQKPALYLTMRQKKISFSELARRLKYSQPIQARRLLDPERATNMKAIDKALAVIGGRLHVGIDDAA